MPMRDKACVITGATNGIGRVAAEEIARAGMAVTLIGRDRARTEQAVAEIRAATGNERVEHLLCDLSLVEGVRALGAELRERHPKLDLLVNNAGAMFTSRHESVEGIEVTFALNHLAYFTLTQELLPSLGAAGEAGDEPARIVNVASEAHRRAGRALDLDDLQLASEGFSGWRQYCRTKLMNVLFTFELARRLTAGGRRVTANCVHPGFVRSGFGKNDGAVFKVMVGIAGALFARSPRRGAEGMVFLSTSAAVTGRTGGYYFDLRELRPSRLALDEALQRGLWERTEALVAEVGAPQSA